MTVVVVTANYNPERGGIKDSISVVSKLCTVQQCGAYLINSTLMTHGKDITQISSLSRVHTDKLPAGRTHILGAKTGKRENSCGTCKCTFCHWNKVCWHNDLVPPLYAGVGRQQSSDARRSRRPAKTTAHSLHKQSDSGQTLELGALQKVFPSKLSV